MSERTDGIVLRVDVYIAEDTIKLSISDIIAGYIANYREWQRALHHANSTRRNRIS